MCKDYFLVLLSLLAAFFTVSVHADSILWTIDSTGVCRDNNGKYPRWSEYNWNLPKCVAACKDNGNCQGFAMHTAKNYCQLFGSDGANDASQPGTQITHGDSSQPDYTCYLKNSASTPSASGFLSRGWITINHSKADCIGRAKSSLASEKIPIEDTTEDYVFWTTGDTIGAIHCLPVNNGKTTAFIVVYADLERRAKYLRDQFYTSMKTGIME